MLIGWIGGGIAFLLFLCGIRIVRPTEKGLIETLGKYTGFAESGFTWLVPIFQRMVKVDITENMMEIDTQEIITEDNLNAKVDLVVYYKVKEDEASVKKSVYKVSNFEPQITRLAQTTARNVIGGMVFKNVNSKRGELNSELAKILKSETANWGVEIVRVELKDINPPTEVQQTMNQVIQAENTKRAAIDFATAKETEADGTKRAAIKEAEGIAQGRLIVAEAKAKAIRVVNKAAEESFKGNAQLQRQYEVAEVALKDNTKILMGDSAKQILKLFDVSK